VTAAGSSAFAFFSFFMFAVFVVFFFALSGGTSAFVFCSSSFTSGSRNETGSGDRVVRRVASAPRRSTSRSVAHACLHPGSSYVRAGQLQLTSRRPWFSRKTTSRVRWPRTFAVTDDAVSSSMETAPLFQRAKPCV
jgi:hypothetical protein